MRQGVRFQVGFLAAMLAASLQLVLWMGALSGAFGQMQADAGTRGGIVYLGHCSQAAGQAPGQTPHKPMPCAVCPICLTAALPNLLAAEPPALMPPLLVAVLRLSLPPPARAPPSAPHTAAFPRGPPTA